MNKKKLEESSNKKKKVVVPTKRKEEKKEEVEEEPPVVLKKKKQEENNNNFADVKAFLEKIRPLCVSLEEEEEDEEEEEELVPKTLESLKKFSKQVEFNTLNKTRRLEINQLLSRGNMIEAMKKLTGADWYEIGRNIGCNAKRPQSSDMIVHPRRLFRLIVVHGITRLRHFCPNKEFSIMRLTDSAKSIVAYLESDQATEEEKTFWKNEPVPMVPVVVKIAGEEEKIVPWVNSRWLLKQ